MKLQIVEAKTRFSYYFFRFAGSVVSSDTGLLAYRKFDDALRLLLREKFLADSRTGTSFGNSFLGRVAGYEDVNDVGCLRHCQHTVDVSSAKGAVAETVGN
jgi:hypothetical protein